MVNDVALGTMWSQLANLLVLSNTVGPSFAHLIQGWDVMSFFANVVLLIIFIIIEFLAFSRSYTTTSLGFRHNVGSQRSVGGPALCISKLKDKINAIIIKR